jgi:hypothetical protein
MNLQDLMTKLRNIEEGKKDDFDALKHVKNPTKGEKEAAKDVKRGSYADRAAMLKSAEADGRLKQDESIEIIGGPMSVPMGHPEQPKQQDSVTMNVSMNGSGAGGIKDLMSILRNIENGSAASHSVEHDHEEPLLGDEEFDEEMGDNGQTFGNSVHGDSGTHVHGVDAVTATGNDMNSKGGSNPHYSPGNNTLRQSTTVHEGLVEKLHNLYNEVKTRDLTESVLTDDMGHTMQHILHTYNRDVRDFEETGEMSENLYDALYDYYFDDMPYGVKKARDGDPYEWVSDRFASDIGMNETMQVDPMQGGAGAGD